MNKYSFSQVDKFLKCPRQYYYKYIMGLEEETTEPLHTGSVVHALIEETFRRVQEDGLEARYDSTFASNLLSEYSLADEYRVKQFLETFFFIMKKNISELQNRGLSEDKILESLRAVSNEVELSDDTFKGFIDMVSSDYDGNLVLSDFKTSKKLLGAFHDSYFQQLLVYAWKYEEQFGRLPDYVCVWYLADGERYFLKVTEEAVNKAIETFMNVVSYIEYYRERGMEHFPCSNSILCKYGSFAELCRG